MLIIAGLKHKVKFIDNLGRDRNELGSYNSSISVISIDKSLTGEKMQKVLIHEVLEAINFEYELLLEHTKICVIETAIFDFIKRNPEFIKEILQDG